MSEKMTNILGYATLFAILGAIWVMFGEDPRLDQGGRGEPVFEGLSERINETATIVLAGTDLKTTLTKTEAGWQVAERNAYSADEEKVTEFLRGLALSERREPKTANRDRFDQLGMGADGIQITLKDDTGGELRSFEMGKRTGSPSGRSLTYMYQATDTRAWLVTNLAEAEVDPVWWLDTDLLSFNEARVKSVALKGVILDRPMGETNFTIQALKGAEKPAPTWKLAEPARTVAGLKLTDVKHVANPLVDPTATLTLQTYDGLTVSLSLYDIEDGSWVQIAAAYDAEARNTGEAGELPVTPVSGEEEAAAIKAATYGWLFKVAESDAVILKRTRADFLEKTSE